MVLVDTSVWIEFLRKTAAPEAQWLREAIAAGEELCICGFVLAEVLQGIRADAQRKRVERLLDSLVYLPMSKRAYILAADIYRRARATGRTIRNTADCLIAACAITHRVPLVHRDRDFVTIADVSRLDIMSP